MRAEHRANAVPACRGGAVLSRRSLVVSFGLAALAARVSAQDKGVVVPDEVAQTLGAAARLQGEARLRMLGLQIYHSRLWVVPGFEAERYDAWPLALDLTYARTLKGSAIAERSLEEMRRAGPITPADGQRWLSFMTEVFPDVKAGDRLTGQWNPSRSASSFFFNGTALKTLVDVNFGARFFGIWLAEHTSQPAMRQALLGRGA
jgi:Chalcone isomerase-like